MKVTDLSLAGLCDLVVITKPVPRYEYDAEHHSYTDRRIGWKMKVSNSMMSDPLDVSFDGELPDFVVPFAQVNLINLRISFVNKGIVYAKCDGFKAVKKG